MMDEGFPILRLIDILINVKELSLVLSFAFLLVAVLFYYKFSKLLYIAFVSQIIGFSLVNLYEDFDKLLLVSLFIYGVLSYNLLLLLRAELNEAYVTPIYNKHNLFAPTASRLKVTLFSEKSDDSWCAYLTNWNENGCFVFLPDSEKLLSEKNLLLTYQSDENIFKQRVKVVTFSKDLMGLGLMYRNEKDNVNKLDASQLITMFEGLGLEPERLQ